MRGFDNKPSFSSTQCAALLCVLAAWFLCASPANAQSASSAAPATPAVQAPAPDPAAKPAAKPKHVITNDDLEPHASVGKDDKLIPSFSPLLDCDASCEQEARNYLGFDSDNEAEWRVQIADARRDLAADSGWRDLLSQGIQQSTYYCNFLLQQSQKTAPSGNDYRSRVQRAQNQKYFEDMDKTLRSSMEATANRMQERIKEVAVLSPVRAGLMYVQANRIFDRTCGDPGTR